MTHEGGGHLAPADLELHAKVARDELRKGGFGGKPPRRPKHTGLLVLLAFVFFVVAFFVLAAVCDPGEEQPPLDSALTAPSGLDAYGILQS